MSGIPDVLRCPHCRGLVPVRQAALDLEPSPKVGTPDPPRPPSPPGRYQFLGRWVRHDFERIVFRLGKEHDTVLAREISCSRRWVAALRRSLRIPRYDRVESLVGKALGRVPDRRLHLKFGISRTTLRRRREKLGVAPAPYKKFAAERAVAEYARLIERMLAED